MNTTVSVIGWIRDANLFSPKSSFFDQPKYTVSIAADMYEEQEIEARIENLKRLNENPYHHQDTKYVRKDLVHDGCGLYFETFHQPRLCKEIKKLGADYNLVSGVYARVLGNIQFLPDGNCFLSPHEVVMLPSPDQSIDEELGFDDDDW